MPSKCVLKDALFIESTYLIKKKIIIIKNHYSTIKIITQWNGELMHFIILLHYRFAVISEDFGNAVGLSLYNVYIYLKGFLLFSNLCRLTVWHLSRIDIVRLLRTYLYTLIGRLKFMRDLAKNSCIFTQLITVVPNYSSWSMLSIFFFFCICSSDFYFYFLLPTLNSNG